MMLSAIDWGMFFDNPGNKKIFLSQISVEIYLRFHWSSVVVKIYGTLPEKRFKPSQCHTIRNTKQEVQVELSNEAAAIIAKDTYRFVILIYALGQFSIHEKCRKTK